MRIKCEECDMIDLCISKQILSKVANKMPRIDDPVEKWQDWMFTILNGLPSCETKVWLLREYRERIRATKTHEECLEIACEIFDKTGVVDPI